MNTLLSQKQIATITAALGFWTQEMEASAKGTPPEFEGHIRLFTEQAADGKAVLATIEEASQVWVSDDATIVI